MQYGQGGLFADFRNILNRQANRFCQQLDEHEVNDIK
jgi:hypothetical protein